MRFLETPIAKFSQEIQSETLTRGEILDMSSNPYIGQITLFGGNYEPVGWKFCQGQLLSTSEYQALFSILGTAYGGDGRTTFALPDLRGRAPLHVGGSTGEGEGLSEYHLGEKLGVENVAITASTMPSHNHELKANNTEGDSAAPSGNLLATPNNAIYQSASNLVAMNSAAITTHTASGDTHNNMQPYLCINFIIAYLGIYPSRN